MKKKILQILSLLAVCLLAFAVLLYPKISKSCAIKGKKAKDFTVYNAQIKPVKLSDFYGKPIVVNFWATWCPPCRSELPAFNELFTKYENQVVFLMVNLDDEISTVTALMKENGYTFPVYYDVYGGASKAYEVESIPETLFINADGTIENFHTGAMTKAILEGYIKKIL